MDVEQVTRKLMKRYGMPWTPYAIVGRKFGFNFSLLEDAPYPKQHYFITGTIAGTDVEVSERENDEPELCLVPLKLLLPVRSGPKPVVPGCSSLISLETDPEECTNFQILEKAGTQTWRVTTYMKTRYEQYDGLLSIK